MKTALLPEALVVYKSREAPTVFYERVTERVL